MVLLAVDELNQVEADDIWIPRALRAPLRPNRNNDLLVCAMPGTVNSPDSSRWAQVREVLGQALELPASERADFVQRTCGADAALAGEVQSLITASDRPGILDEALMLANAPLGSADDATLTMAAWDGTTSEPSHGAKLGHYELIRKIGEGGMGAVYEAIDQNLGRRVAVKVMSKGFIGPDERKRFAREARSASALNHPNIITIYEFNTSGEVDYIVMEYVEGDSLHHLLKAGRTPLPALLGYARQVAAALAKAHEAGIVHRDLKPGNIMVTPEGTAKVLDFGLAKQESAPDHQMTALTQVGAVMGTPAYMSPEQAMGEATDARSDIFSFGVILYELVCGRRPFQGSNATATLRQIINKEAEPVLSVNAGAPPAVATLINRCLVKERNQRLASMAEALPVLDAAGVKQTTAARLSASLHRALPSRRLGLGLTAAIVLVAAGITYAPTLLRRAAILPPDSFALYQKGTELLKKKYRKEYLEQAIDTLNQAIALKPDHAASYAALAEAYVARYSDASDPQWLKLASGAADRAVELDPDLAAAQVADGMAAVTAQRYDKAEEALKKAIQLDTKNAMAHRWLGILSDRRKQPGQAEKELEASTVLAPTEWEPWLALGLSRLRREDYTGAIAAWENARTLASDNPSVFRNLATAYHALGRDEEAAKSLQRSLEIEPSALTNSNLGTLRYFQGRYPDAVEAFEKAVGMNANNHLYWGNLGDAYRWAPGMRGKSADAYRQAIKLGRVELGKNRVVPGRIALYLAKIGNDQDATKQLAAIPKTDFDAAMHFRTAVIHELGGRRDSALASLKAALTAGYARSEIDNDPELLSLRNDVRYHRLQTPAPIAIGAK
jgi:eukaryotic-like serine/threonine-protein kinase